MNVGDVLTRYLPGIGGEAVALAASTMHPRPSVLLAMLPSPRIPAMKEVCVKQAGRFSFARVFDAGHATAFYQPETVYELFMRAMFNNDLATGKEDLNKNKEYATEGPTDSWGWTNTLPDPPENECSLWAVPGTCNADQAMALALGNATISEFQIVSSPGGQPVLPPQDDAATGTGSTNGNSTGTSGGAASSGTNNSGAAGFLGQLSFASLAGLVGVSVYLGMY